MRTPVTMVAIAALAIALSVSATAQWAKQAGVDVRVEDLLKQMTLEEKVGQMTQVTLDVVLKDADGKAEPHGLDQAKLEKAILQYHVGSILNAINYAYSVDQWYEIISAIQDVASKKARLHIPVLYGIDAIHGATYTMGAALFPQTIAMAASWNPELARREGEITAAVLVIGAMVFTGHVAMWTILAVGLFNSIMFPTIFSLALEGLGKHTGQGSGILCMSIVGGAIIPLLQGVLADRIGIHHAFILPVLCYLFIAYYGFRGHIPSFRKA